MPVILCFILVVVIQGVTPISIQWSNDSVSYLFSSTTRVLLSTVLGWIILRLTIGKIFDRPGIWKAYLAASIGIFPNMPLIYWSAQFIPTGLLAVLGGLLPLSTAFVSMLITRQNPFNLRRTLGVMIGLCGLVIIFRDQMQIGTQAVYGIVGMLGSSFLFAFSNVLLKIHGQGIEPLRQTVGSLLFSVPGMILAWWLMDGVIPETISTKSVVGVLYMTLFGTLIGFMAFYYILKKLPADVVALTPMLAPVLALWVGVTFAGDVISPALYLGATLSILSLVVYQGIGFKLFARRS